MINLWKLQLRTIHCTVGAVALFAATSFAQQVPKLKPWSTKVELAISAKPAHLKDEIESYVRREIRALGDVEIVETNGNYRIEIHAFELRSRGGDVRGVSITTILQMPFYWDTVKGVLGGLTDTDRRFLEGYTALSIEIGVALDSGAPEDVPHLCRQIVISIDSTSFESSRKMYGQMIDELRAKGAMRDADANQGSCETSCFVTVDLMRRPTAGRHGWRQNFRPGQCKATGCRTRRGVEGGPPKRRDCC